MEGYTGSYRADRVAKLPYRVSIARNRSESSSVTIETKEHDDKTASTEGIRGWSDKYLA